MIDLSLVGSSIELNHYDQSDTLDDLRKSVEQIRTHAGLRTAGCAGCGECCFYDTLPVLGYDLAAIKQFLSVTDQELYSTYLVLPEKPDMAARAKAVEELIRQNKLNEITANILYEYNQAEPIRLAKSEDGSCRFLQENLCTIYENRLYTGALYVCNMAERLSILQEQIVRQGVWHSYLELGWISEKDIPHNPYIGHDGFFSVPIASFDIDLSEALEHLFFYF